MSEQNEHKVERPDWWPDGPWMTEPDKLNWKTEAGLPGMIVRNRSGALCGYVAVTKEHPLYRVEYSSGDWPDSPEGQIDVHGGLTYSAACRGSICHVPEPGEPDNVWWFGFDCAHCGDWTPAEMAPYLGSYRTMPGGREQYRDIEYVKREVESLARQLAALGSP